VHHIYDRSMGGTEQWPICNSSYNCSSFHSQITLFLFLYIHANIHAIWCRTSTHAKMLQRYAYVVLWERFCHCNYVDGSDNAFALSVPGESDRYMTVRSNGGLNQMRTGVSTVHQNLAMGSSLSILISTCFHIYKYIFVLVQIIASFLFSRVFWLICAVMFATQLLLCYS